MTSLAAVIATIATAGLATDVTTNQGTGTQQEIVHIFDAANRITGHNDDYLPTLVDAVYNLWPTVIVEEGADTEVPVVYGVSIGSNDRLLADTTRTHTVEGDDISTNWRDFQANRDMTLEAISEALFGDHTGLDAIDTNHFRSIDFIDAGEAAPTLQDVNDGIVGDAIDNVIADANLANWNAVRANGASAAGIALQNAELVNDVINERIAINRVLAEYDEAKVRIEDGLL